VSHICQTLTRKKQLDVDILETPLRRCLNLFDLLLLGIGHMVGAGIFVITGTVAKNIAGPSVVLSYLLAGFAAMLSALCYAEFGARVPKAGSAYTYTYVTIGEFFAFLIGWNMILESLIGAASVARAWSGSFDTLFNSAIRNGTIEHLGAINAPGLSVYPDFIALGIVILVAVFVSAGAKVSTNFNSTLTVINLLILAFIMIVGFYLADVTKWTDSANGGFTPFGFSGVIAGAGSCFYAYIGFEGIATAGEEAKDPSKTIPLATGIAVAIVSLLYIGCSAALTLMVSYKDVVIEAPFPSAFDFHGMNWAKYVVAVGSLVGISTSLIGSLFTLPRSVYAMASDGLFFRAFANVNPRTQTPILSIVVFGLATGFVALLFDLNVLVELLSIGTLLSFTIVAASIIVLHYQPVTHCQFQLRPDQSTLLRELEDSASDAGSVDGFTEDRKRILKTSQSHEDIGKLKTDCLSLPVLKNLAPGRASVVAVVGMTVFMTAFWLLIFNGTKYLSSGAWWSILLLIIFSIGLILSFLILIAHERNTSFLTFQVRTYD
jgi:solute carrier family 7 (cationic amino acid transporter), member 4